MAAPVIESKPAPTEQPTFSIDKTVLANRLTAIRAKFTPGQKITPADVNELIAIIRIFQTHHHVIQDKFYVQWGPIFVMNSRTDADVTQPPKLIP
jgi:hypothetical protein